LRTPDVIAFDTLDDLAACAGELASLQRFTQLHRFIQEREPRLLAWLAQRPMSALEHSWFGPIESKGYASLWDRLFAAKNRRVLDSH
jgi:hypothetical protein